VRNSRRFIEETHRTGCREIINCIGLTDGGAEVF
jgi:hypothetical protein